MASSETIFAARSSVLSNIGAEFVEKRAGKAIISRVTEMTEEEVEVQLPPFNVRRDSFIPVPQDPSDEELYTPSKEKVARFQEILRKFSEILKERQVFKKLAIEIRDPKDFDLKYVMALVNAVKEHREGAKNTRKCKRFVQSCLKSVTKHKTAIRGIIEMVPTDIYGSVISGGFALVLAAVENDDKIRTDIQDSLVEIPKHLERVEQLSSVYQSNKLHQCVDGVLVSIFSVLETIIDRLSLTFKENAWQRIKSQSGEEIKAALKDLESNIKDFNTAIQDCAHIKLSRIDETVVDIKNIGLDIKESLNGRTEEDWIEMEKRIIGGVAQKIYQCMTSIPMFNAQNGLVNKDEAKYYIATQLQRSIEASSSGRIKDLEQYETWLTTFGNFDPKDDVQKCMARAASLTMQEKDKVQYIMGSEMFQDWLSKPESYLLGIKPEIAPQELINPMSVATALLGSGLNTPTQDYAVLSFFTGLRKSASQEETDSGVLGILNSLNGQLLKFILEKQQSIDLSSLEAYASQNKSIKNADQAFKVFDKLLPMLPAPALIFILVDSISRIAGDKNNGDKLVEKIRRIMDKNPNIVIKMLVTGTLPSSNIKKLAHGVLHVPNDIDGWQCGANFKSLEEKSALKVRKSRAQQRRRRARSSSEENEDDEEETSTSEDDSGGSFS